MEIKTIRIIEELIDAANEYIENGGDNIFQELFYHSDLVDREATAEDANGTVYLQDGSTLIWDPEYRTWIH